MDSLTRARPLHERVRTGGDKGGWTALRFPAPALSPKQTQRLQRVLRRRAASDMGCARAIEALLGRQSEAAREVSESSGHGEGAGKQVLRRGPGWSIIPGVAGPHMLIGSTGPLGSRFLGWPLSVRLLSHHRPDGCEWLLCWPRRCASTSRVWTSSSNVTRSQSHTCTARPKGLDQTGTNRSQREGPRTRATRSGAEQDRRRPTRTRSRRLSPTPRSISASESPGPPVRLDAFAEDWPATA